ncbi:hypothetical protein EUBDOL_00709 [Amedibacillus dolichus DSM 3991]|uniref:Polyhydroxyalkanoate synthesis regulator phasin n=2 Tax=Amedibacillus dolichus TaxID=31971 RepID=A8RA53_9FIRM|nr:hypothetical protein EUBDOL_00709 [Amedibacillus dolichus DSM 3991]
MNYTLKSDKIEIRKEVLIMLDRLGEDVKKVLLAGIGAAALTAEKSKDVIDELVKKGELTVEQGKIINEELKHDIKEKLKLKKDVDQIGKMMEDLSAEELAVLKAKLEALQDNGEVNE